MKYPKMLSNIGGQEIGSGLYFELEFWVMMIDSLSTCF